MGAKWSSGPIRLAPLPAAEFTAADGPLHRILKGTIVDTVLTNRLDGAATAPVNCLVSTPSAAARCSVTLGASSS